MASEEEVIIDLRKMRIPELKKELTLRGLKTSGNKQELIERLQTYLEEHEGAEVTDDEILKEEEEGETDDHLIDDQKIEDAVLAPPADESKVKSVKKPPNLPKVSKDGEEEGEEQEKGVTDLHSPTGLSDAEKLKIRAEKYGVAVADMNADARKAVRAERFGTGSSVGGAPSADPDKLKKRAERFGGSVSASVTTAEEEERRRKRQARFGANTSTVGLNDTDKKKRRAERFGVIA